MKVIPWEPVHVRMMKIASERDVAMQDLIEKSMVFDVIGYSCIEDNLVIAMGGFELSQPLQAWIWLHDEIKQRPLYLWRRVPALLESLWADVGRVPLQAKVAYPNAAARKFAARLGFERIGIFTFDDKQKAPIIYYRKAAA